MGKRGTARGKKPARVRDGVGKKAQVLYCEKCCQTGAHVVVADVRRCYGRGVVMGRDFRWVTA